MKYQKVTWIGFLGTLLTLTVSPKTPYEQGKYDQQNHHNTLEKRLSRISENLQAREKKLSLNSQLNLSEKHFLLTDNWSKSPTRSNFVNGRSRGGRFVNRRNWLDKGGFYNRR